MLGPLEAWADGQRVRVGGARAEKLLAALALELDRAVPVDRLVDVLWDDDPPATASRQVQNTAAALRRLLSEVAPGELLVTDGPGYRLASGGVRVDTQVFFDCLALARDAVAVGELAKTVEELRCALNLWRGPALAGIGSHLLAGAAVELDERRLSTLEHCVELELELGRHRELIGELSALVASHPLRERFTAQLMLALYRGGRAGDALDACRRLRIQLADELGLDAGPELRRLESAILRADPALEVTLEIGRSAAPPPRQLPADIPAFVGREPLLDSLLPTGNLVITAIDGTAGVGKTALAVRFAHRIADRFPDGQLYVDLRGFDPAAAPLPPGVVLGQFLRALGSHRVPSDLDERASLYRTLLADKRMLILLDNAASTEQVRPLLPGSPTCLVLTTSRDRLTGLVIKHGARRLTVDLLTPDEAVLLLRQTVGTARVDHEPGAATELAELAARLPLALRIVAERANQLPDAPLAELAAELRAERSGLDALDTDEANLRTAFSYSYRALDPATASMFRLLGLGRFRDIGIPACSALTGQSTSDTRHQLRALARANLLTEHPPGRYAFHDLLRAYARELTGVLDGEPTRRSAIHRVLDFYLHTAYNAYLRLTRLNWPIPLERPDPGVRPLVFADYHQALAWCETERDNLLAATECAASQGFPSHAWQLPCALWEFYYLRKYWADWVTGHESALTAASQLGDRRAEARVLNGLGAAHGDQGQLDLARAYYRQSIDAALETGDRYGEAVARHNLGNVYRQEGRHSDALAHYQHALTIDRAVGERNGEGIVLACIADCYRALARYPEALANYQAAIAIHRANDEPRGQANALHGIAEVYRELGRTEPALDHYQRALALRRTTHDTWGTAATLNSLATLHNDTGEPAIAHQHQQEAGTLLGTIT